MKRFRRVALVVVLVLLLLVVGLYIAARLYLSSGAVTRQVQDRLQTMLGAPVEVQSADVGLFGGSTLHGLRIFEPGDDSRKAPIVVVDGASADLSAVDVLAGKSPTNVTLTGASIALHFDADGNLVTRLPKPHSTGGPMPRLHIEGGKLTINQDGRKAMLVQGIKGDLTPNGADLKAGGAVTDPFWGDWSLSGGLAGQSGAIDLTLDAKNVTVDKDRLTGLPFVAPVVWQQVIVEGKTPCNFNLRLQLADHPRFHYRVQCDPQDATVQAPSIEMNADHAAGQVVVDDNLVQLRGVHGKFAGGDVAADADLDFRQAAWVLTFSTVSVDKIVWHELPKTWVDALLPEFLKDYKPDGVFHGKAADIRVTVENGKVHVSGTGQGEIDNVTLDGKPQPAPIKLTLGTRNGKLGNVSLNPRPSLMATALAATVGLATPPAEAPAAAPVDLARWMVQGTASATNSGLAALGKGVKLVGTWLRPATAPEPPPEYLTMDLGLQDIDLAQLLQRLKFQLPFALEGRLTFKVHAEIPINTPEDLKNYRMSGTANLPTLNVAGVALADVEAQMKMADGVLEMLELKGKALAPPPPGGGGQGAGAGAFEGTGRVQVAPLGDLSGNLRVDHFPLDVLLSRLPGAGGAAEGSFSGRVELRGSVKTPTDPTTWHASGNVSSDRIAVYGAALTAASADVSVDGGTAKVSGLKATLEKAAVTGDASLTLASPWKYNGRLSVKGLDLAAAQRLAPDVRPPFDVQGAADATADVHGALSPFALSASGTASGSDLALDRFKVDSLSLKWDMDRDHVKLSDLKAKLYQGDITGSADVPVRSGAGGAVDVKLDDVDLQALAKSLPSMPLRVQGKASGSVQATIPAAGPDGQRQATGKIDLSSKAMMVQNIPTDNVHADVDYKAGVAEYHLKGDSLGGHFTLDGKIPFIAAEEKTPPPGGGDGAAPDKDQPIGSGRFRFTGIQLSRLSQALGLGAALSHLHGRADIDLPFQLGADNALTGTGTLNVRNLRLGDAVLTDSLTADLLLKNQTVQVRNVNASLGQGGLRGTVVYNLQYPERGYFRLQLEQVDASALLASYPGAAAQVLGPVDVRLRGNFGRTWHGSGEADLTRGRVFGAAVDELHVPVTFEFSPARGSGRAAIRDANAQLAGGRATVQAELDWAGGEPPRLEGYARFNNAEVRSLVKPGGQLGSYLVGRVTGRVDFSGDAVQSLDDLNATVNATLADSQALEIPVLSALVPFVAPGQSATTFEKGDLRGRLSRGVFRVQRLTLSSSLLRMAIVGTVNTQGRLDLDVTGQTGQVGYNPAFLRAIGLRIPAVGPIPVSLLLEASALLSNRVIHLRVTGTVRNPDVHLEPVQLLAEEAVRFFVLQSGAPVP
ncbi:MAG TPA: AsmA-like C-terminal region-containing protein [Gemmataceae bacterium]|nr:AsmA-like C-terminal region-containing protein [Gemmataceae bacterium]